MSETQPSRPDLNTRLKKTWRWLRVVVTGSPPPAERRPAKVRVIAPESKLVIDPLENERAADYFIRVIRDPNRYTQDPYDPTALRSGIDLVVKKPLERGYFTAHSVLTTAAERYGLPMAMYISGQHARLVLKNPYYFMRERIWKIPVYDPMTGTITEIEQPRGVQSDLGIYPNNLAEQQLKAEIYDITFLKDYNLAKFHDPILLAGKFQALQRDYSNCIPYCLFVNAMLHGLALGDTDFKKRGIPQFQRDFGVRIRTRAEVLGIRISVR